MIVIEELRKSYGKNEILKGVNWTQKKGELAVVIGPSGCGKSTFLRCLNQLETFDSGKISIDGIVIDHTTKKHTKEEQKNILDLGGSMRLGAYKCKLKKGSRVYDIYKKENSVSQNFNMYPFLPLCVSAPPRLCVEKTTIYE